MSTASGVHELDKIDRQILRIVQTDGRISNAELARKVRLSPTPCLERVRRLEREGFITGYGAFVNPGKAGRPVIIFIEIRLDHTGLQVFDRFRAAVRELPEVMECHMIVGAYDYLLKLRVPDIGSYQRFMSDKLPSLPGVIQTHSHVVMDEVKSTHVLPID